jgi:hypothetical protein
LVSMPSTALSIAIMRFTAPPPVGRDLGPTTLSRRFAHLASIKLHQVMSYAKYTLFTF